MKKFLSFTLAVLLVFSCFGTLAMADESPITVTINGVLLTFDVQPQIVNDRTLVPIRAISEYLGYQVGWTAANQQIDIQDAETAMVMHIGSTEYTVNEVTYQADVAPQIISDRTFVPLRLIGETFNAEVSWNAPERAVTIKVDLSTDVPFETTGSYVNGKDYRAMGITGFVPATGTVPRETTAGNIQGDATLFQPVSDMDATAMIEAYDTHKAYLRENEYIPEDGKGYRVTYENLTNPGEVIKKGDIFEISFVLQGETSLTAAQVVFGYNPAIVQLWDTEEDKVAENYKYATSERLHERIKVQSGREEVNKFEENAPYIDTEVGQFCYTSTVDLVDDAFTQYDLTEEEVQNGLTLIKVQMKALEDGDADIYFPKSPENMYQTVMNGDWAQMFKVDNLIVGEGVVEGKMAEGIEPVEVLSLNEIPDILNKELSEGVGAIKVVTKEIDEANGTLLYEAQAAGYTLYVKGLIVDGRYYEVKVCAETEYFEGHRENILNWMDTFEVVK